MPSKFQKILRFSEHFALWCENEIPKNKITFSSMKAGEATWHHITRIIQWFVAWRHQAINQKNVDLSLIRSCVILMKVVSQITPNIHTTNDSAHLGFAVTSTRVQCIALTSPERMSISNHHNSTYCSAVFSGWQQRKTKTPHYWPIVDGIHWWPVDSFHKGPVMRKPCPCCGVIMDLMVLFQSYGGFVALHVLGDPNKSPFTCAVAVAPVTDWHYYDTCYTERYLGLERHNYKGYDVCWQWLTFAQIL